MTLFGRFVLMRSIKNSLLIAVSLLMSHAAFAFNARTFQLESKHYETVEQFVQANRRIADIAFKRDMMGLEIWIASPTWAQPESYFGHVFLRFVDRDDDPLNDIVVNFNQMILDPQKMYAKSFGGYPMVPKFFTLMDSFVAYMKLEVRPLRRFIIPTSPRLMSNLKHVLKALVDAPYLLEDYHYTQNNCLTGILKALKAAGYPVLPGAIYDIPGNVENKLNYNFLNFYPKSNQLIFSGASQIIEKIEAPFKPSFVNRVYKKIVDEDWIEEMLAQPSFWSAIEVLPADQLEFLLFYWPNKWRSGLERIYQIADQKALRVSSARELIQIPQFPSALYELCEPQDQECRKKRIWAALSIWSPADLLDQVGHIPARRQTEIKRFKQMTGGMAAIPMLNGVVPKDLEQFARDLHSYVRSSRPVQPSSSF